MCIISVGMEVNNIPLKISKRLHMYIRISLDMTFFYCRELYKMYGKSDFLNSIFNDIRNLSLKIGIL